MRKDERYNKRGVSASKEDVHNAIKNIDKGVFPRAFAKSYRIIWEEMKLIATSCMQTEQEQSLR